MVYLENNILSQIRGAKDFVGRAASHFGAVVTTCSREPIGNQFCKSPPCFLLQRWRRVLSPDIVKLSGPVHVLQMSPVHVLQMSPVHVLQMSPVQVLQNESSPCFTNESSPGFTSPVQSMFYNMPCRKACRRSSSSSQRFRWLTRRVVLRLTSTRRVALRRVV